MVLAIDRRTGKTIWQRTAREEQPREATHGENGTYASSSAITDGQGRYLVTELRPGIYTVTITLPGFSAVKRDNVELTTGFTATVNAELRVGTLGETVTVSVGTAISRAA